MEENIFCYIQPRVKVQRKDYLHYSRKRKDMFIYAVHADYHVLLQACAKVAQVKVGILHIDVLNLEKRLQRLEERIDSSLHHEPDRNDLCDFCKDETWRNAEDDPTDLNS
ncbi:hypothetical protein CDL12_23250 [Handroanthus impetiginosus]|uniref:Uncharacterized protein n=1 Tax=Handroanthus impetiginosus TaxID=429701 RepID=A0A2G9GG00_9LAMI|nr:hypothetical protein CDL12_23250 [Handroanthus impetiginosus]